MARGNRGEPIVFSDDDRKTFVKTLGQATVKSGWEILAWVLMKNHYHLVLRTPEPNLVAGMTWFQNAYTRRINTHNGLWGHLFGGRYKAILVEPNEFSGKTVYSDYLATLINYVHLNPARAGLISSPDDDILSYPWSSVTQGYALPPSKRPKWIQVNEGLDLFQFKDTSAGRRKYTEYLDQINRGEQVGDSGIYHPGGQSLQSTLRRGWYWGSDAFKENILERFGSAAKSSGKTNQSSRFCRDHGKKRALEIIEEALIHYNLDREQLKRKVRGDFKRTSVAWMISKTTTQPYDWIAKELNMKSAANVSQQLRRFDIQIGENSLPKEIKGWIKSQESLPDP